MGSISCSFEIVLKDSPKYMNQFGYVTTLSLWRGTSVLEWLGMIGIWSIVFYVIMGVSSNAL